MKILVIHSIPVVSRGLHSVLESAGIECLESAWNGYRALTPTLNTFEPDVVLADHQIPGLQLKRLTSTVAAWSKEATVAIISIDDPGFSVNDAVNAAANGYISLRVSNEELVASLRLLGAGQVVAVGPTISTLADIASARTISADENFALTDRETQISILVAQGLTNGDIASQLELVEGTVKIHIRNIFRKLGLSNRAELTGFALRSGITK
ncbi:LuxR C-terminal-related transcriptional regulator [Candidatus Lucifugimonas marina]|uniref:Response regulator n=1 Tax=Candidatus Lucifugimonas marina TaxID=3038979 RepID=A0AAJ5ZE72_9CHLR|nr:response regulator [SAR202 cluster bacterium JH702]MDG0870968.1 response regulator [SAR202 cluster bacterium JH639]WFG35878.1 response regulator [SAR202 cluster bacterium JH545]WFG39822.1 response regulator [SAR202 cluster bacterium JH1073]